MNKSASIIILYLCVGLSFGAIIHSRQEGPRAIVATKANSIVIDSTYDILSDNSLQVYLEPYRLKVEETMNEVIGVASETMTAHKPESLLSNWSSDVLLKAANELSDKRVDMAIMNLGGLRCAIPQGNILLRKTFELMPFENELVILTLAGSDLLELCDLFAAKGGEGVSGLRFGIKDGKAIYANINWRYVSRYRTYTIATSNYLAEGNDGMEPLAKCIQKVNTGKKLRDIFREFILEESKQGREIQSKLDKRIAIIN